MKNEVAGGASKGKQGNPVSPVRISKPELADREDFLSEQLSEQELANRKNFLRDGLGLQVYAPDPS